MLIAKYKLKKDLPNLPAGVIFEHREYDPQFKDRGNIGTGVMILGWLNRNCQPNKTTHPNGNYRDSWCGETYIFPGQLAGNTEWFEKVEDCAIAKIKEELKELQRKVDRL